MKNIVGKYIICKPSDKGYDEYLSSDGWCRDVCVATTYDSYEKAIPAFGKARSKNKRRSSIQVKVVTGTMLFDSLQLAYYLGKSRGKRQVTSRKYPVAQSAY